MTDVNHSRLSKIKQRWEAAAGLRIAPRRHAILAPTSMHLQFAIALGATSQRERCCHLFSLSSLVIQRNNMSSQGTCK